MLIADSYSESNYSTAVWINNPEISFGQSFTGNGGTLNNVKFYLKRQNSPTGNAYAKIYSHTGTFGTNGVPTGSPLATSDAVDVSLLATSFALVTFTFSGAEKITLTNGTKYFVLFSFADVGYPTNYVNVGIDISTPSHSGNSASSTDDTNWTADATTDCIFYVYTNQISPFPSHFNL